MDKNEFLGILYHYRERLIEAYSKPGWNKWALLGSLSALVWLLISLLKDESVNILSGIPLLFIFILMSPLLRLVPDTQKTKSHTSNTIYLSLRQEISEDSYSTFCNFLVLGFVLFYSNYHLVLPTPFKYVLNLYLCIILLLLLGIVIISRLDFYSPNIESQKNKIFDIGKIIGSLFILVLGGISIIGFGSIINNWKDYSMWQSGLILYGLYFILQKIVEEFEGNPSLDSINALIDDVTFDKRTIPEAEKELKLIWFGAEFKDIIAPLITDFISANEKYQSLILNTRESCDQYYKADSNLKASLKTAVYANVADASKAELQLVDKVNKIKRKLAFFYPFERENQDYREVITTMDSFLGQSTKIVNELNAFIAENEISENEQG